MFYEYSIIEKPESEVTLGDRGAIDMENLDYKRQPPVGATIELLAGESRQVCGVWRGGMFGLATNQISVLSVCNEYRSDPIRVAANHELSDCKVLAHSGLVATVRPESPPRFQRDGFYVLRWIRMRTADIAEYTGLCLQTWPAFQAAGTAYCHGVFKPVEEGPISKLLMVTWYASMSAWEKSRQLEPADEAKWARRSEMELSHWADGARLAVY